MTIPVFSLQWHITDRCAQRCRHCYIYNRGVNDTSRCEMPFATCTAVVDDLIDACKILGAKPRVSLTGGDPLLHPNFWDILAYARAKDVMVSVLGNPFEINEEIVAHLRALGVNRFQLSLDGMQDTHDSWRKVGSFRETERAINVLHRGGIKVGVMSTVSKSNAGDLPLLARRVAEFGVSTYAFARYCPASPQDAGEMFTPMEYRAFLLRMWEVFTELSETATNFVLKDHLWLLLLSELGLFTPESTDGIAVSGCGLGISHLTLLPDGTVYACRRFPSPLGKFPQDHLHDLFVGETLERYRDWTKFEKCSNCAFLQYCRGCMAVAYGTTGRWNAPDPQCWK